MVGNVYVQFREEDQAQNELQNLVGRYYETRPIIADFSPVTDFREATCRQYEENVCNRGGYCNFMHLKKISRELRHQLFRRSARRNLRSRSRSRSPRHRVHEERHSSSHVRRGDNRHHDKGRRPRSRSPGRRSGRSRSPGGRRNRSPVREARESSAERRAKIEQWNKEREDAESGRGRDSNPDDGTNQGAGHIDERSYDNNQHPSEQGNGDHDF